MVTSYGRLKICIFDVLDALWAYICPMPVTIGVYLSNACPHRTRYSSQCFSMIWNSSPEPSGTLRIFPEWAICYSSGPPQHAPGVRMTWVLTNSLKIYLYLLGLGFEVAQYIYLKAYALPPTPERTRTFQSLCDLGWLFLVFTYCVFVSWLEANLTGGW